MSLWSNSWCNLWNPRCINLMVSAIHYTYSSVKQKLTTCLNNYMIPRRRASSTSWPGSKQKRGMATLPQKELSSEMQVEKSIKIAVQRMHIRKKFEKWNYIFWVLWDPQWLKIRRKPPVDKAVGKTVEERFQLKLQQTWGRIRKRT